MAMRKRGMAFHCHHDRLYEFVYDYDERVEFIKSNKPSGEQELRLRLFKLIPDDLLPGQDSQEWEAYDKAWEAGEAYNKAWEDYAKAREDYGKAQASPAKKAYNKAGEAYYKAGEAYYKAREAYYKAWEDYAKAREAYYKAFGKELETLHGRLCPNCPWDGKTIFTGK